MYTLQILRENNRLGISRILIVMSLFCFFLSLTRVYFTGRGLFLFLNWNLFLAFIPWLATTYLRLKPEVQQHKRSLILIVGCWLLFFPNAPYIITDLFHLRYQSGAPIWFDTILIMSFAWTGLIYGFVSLMDIEHILDSRLKPIPLKIIISLLLFLSAFGIYLGRFLRWNSWDIIREPLSLFYDIGKCIIHPTDHPTTWGVTTLMGILLNMMYWSLKLLKNQKRTS